MALESLVFNACASIAALFLLEWSANRFTDQPTVVARRLGVSLALIALLTAGGEWEEV